MKITHVCLSAFYCEGYSYQENLLSQYHRKMGYDVDVIASLQSFDTDGRPCILPQAEEYVNDYGIHVVRLDYARPLKLARVLRRYKGLPQALEASAPDILFVHGVQSSANAEMVRYVRSHPGVRLFMDNHADYSNSATNWLSKHVLHRVVWRHYARMTLPYAERYWGVLPARVDFLVDNYGLPRERCDLLVMGADDELVKAAKRSRRAAEIRAAVCADEGDVLLVTGGKIDLAKTQMLALMEAAEGLADRGVRLLVFGPVVPELRGRFDALATAPNITYAGRLDSRDSYDYFEAADLVCFPGRHSVFWEQAAGQGKPMLLKRWEGYGHIDCDGNVAYTSGDDAASLRGDLEGVLAGGCLDNMTTAARTCANGFLYSAISKRSIADCGVAQTKG